MSKYISEVVKEYILEHDALDFSIKGRITKTLRADGVNEYFWSISHHYRPTHNAAGVYYPSRVQTETLEEAEQLLLFTCRVLQTLMSHRIRTTERDLTELANMIFSQQDEFRPKAMKLWNAMRQDSDVRTRIGSLVFRNMRDVPALQAADLLAYELRHFYHLLKTKSGTPHRWAFREIVLHQRNAHQTFMLKYLPTLLSG